MGKTEEEIMLLQTLKKRLPKKGDILLKFHIYIGEGMAYARMLEFKKGLYAGQIYMRLLGRLKIPKLYRKLANLFTNIGHQNKALFIIDKLLSEEVNNLGAQDLQILNAHKAILLASAGRYNECRHILKQMDKYFNILSSLFPLIRAQIAIGEGRIYDAVGLSQIAILNQKRANY